MSDPADKNTWEEILENARAKIEKNCQRMVAKPLPNGNILQFRCKKVAKYQVVLKGEELNPPFRLCVEHVQEMKSRPDATVEPLDPKLMVMT